MTLPTAVAAYAEDYAARHGVPPAGAPPARLTAQAVGRLASKP